jgi:LAO/AO transport system ATPase
MLEALLERFRRRDRLALARLLSLVARGQHVLEILKAVGPPPKASRVVAVTGSGGVGKSTLIGKLIEQVRRDGQTVAVLACDPQSPLSGGALLGDRFRMPAQPDDGVFIRSLAAAPGKGAVAEHLDGMVRLLEVFGFDLILIETVGAGQGDTAVRELADVVVLLLQPETGDDLQWEKAGVLEVADIVVLQKADLPGAERVEAQVRAALGWSAAVPVPVLRVSAKTGEGVEQLWRAIAACPARRHIQTTGTHYLFRLAQEALAAWFRSAEATPENGLQQLVNRWQRGEIDDSEATSALWHLLESAQASDLDKSPRR